MINIYEPYFNDKNLKYAHDAIDSTWISSHGKYLNIIKDRLLDIMGTKYVLLCNNGTTATHLMSIGLKYKFSKIKNLIVPNNVYVAAWNSFLVNPIFNLIPVDSDLETWNISLTKMDEILSNYSPEDTAILVVHNIGNVLNVPILKEKYKKFIFIEDNCEGFLGEYNGFKSGSSSLMSSVSFFGNKNITSGEGGALFTDDLEIFEYLNSVRTQGSTNTKFVFNKMGYNYRMTNIQAAILNGQLDDLYDIMDKKSYIFELYKKDLNGFVDLQKIEDGTKHSNWMFGIKFKNVDIDSISLSLYKQGIETRPMFPPISYHKHLSIFANVGEEKNSEYLYRNSIILPSHPNLLKGDINYICNLLKKLIK
jgi:perosamine synthetase